MTSADELPPLPGIDSADGLKRMMNKASLYEKVLRDFHARFFDETALIRDAIAAGDFDAAKRHAHSTKGLAGTIGAMALQDLAKALEETLSVEQLPSTELLDEFDRELRLVIDGIARGFDLAPPSA